MLHNFPTDIVGNGFGQTEFIYHIIHCIEIQKYVKVLVLNSSCTGLPFENPLLIYSNITQTTKTALPTPHRHRPRPNPPPKNKYSNAYHERISASSRCK